ncbi:response regulator transcription factor [Aquiflexum sp. TKW24L]|uniref:response regulator transcription factor n=1 Tax=Aquiflexum sp. TKW24L TaxID=2942212 RepID=UPI0020C131D4|nr:response regulator transcription factor [Aquiflexum sp. TKW24L]MCL6261714.1 response regulator transcription factor [Aquiflexum sp. TKW24L]
MEKSIVITDDHELFATGLKYMIAASPEFDLVGSFRNGKELLDFLKAGNKSDMLILDLEMPVLDGFEVLEFLKNKKIRIKKLVVSTHHTVASIEKARVLGADGFISKAVTLSFLMDTIRTIFNGNSYFQEPTSNSPLDFDIELCKKLISSYHLTKREIEIVNLTKAQLECTEIADKLNLSTLTVKTHRRNILKKLQLKNFVGLVDLLKNQNGY